MESKKKILFVMNSLYGGGAEKVFQTLVNNLSIDKYDITVYSVNRDKIDKKIYRRDFSYYYIFNSGDSIKVKIENKIKLLIYNYLSPSIFYKLFIKGKYDYEIAFIEGYATRIVSGSKNKKSKKYAWVHVDLINTPWTDIAFKNRSEENECYRYFDKIFCVSKEVKNAFEKKYGINNVYVQYNPIDEKGIIKKSNEFNVQRNADIQLITLGRLVDQKGYDRLLRVVLKLKNEGYDNFNIWILGDGQKKQEYLSFISQNHLDNYITLCGFKDNPYPYIKASDAFICSSLSEGFSTVATESLILGKPIFTVECAGMAELFNGYNCGRIVENSEESLYYLLCNMLNDKNWLSDNNDIAIRKNDFTLIHRMSEIEQILQ